MLMGDDEKGSGVPAPLTRGSPAYHLRKLATPMIVGLLAILSFDAVDLFFVAQLGDAPLAAFAFTFPVILFVGSIGIGFEAGAASCVSRAVGQGDPELARRLTTDTVTLTVSIALIVALLGVYTLPIIFPMLGATAELMPLVHDYMDIWYWTVPPSMAMWVSLAAIRARGNSLFESKLLSASAAINAILDPILIFGLFGFPRMELQGAALASLIANLVTLSYTVLVLHLRFHAYANPIACFKTILSSWRRMLRIGIPAMATNTIIPVANGIVVAMLAVYGTDVVAGFGIAMRIEPIALIAFYALSAVASPFAGQNFGAGEYGRVGEALRVITVFCVGSGLLLAVALGVLAQHLVGLFSEAANIARIAVHYLWIVPISYGAYGLVMSVNATFNGMGYPLPGVLLSAARVLIIFLPLAFAGRAVFGIEGLFAASALSNLIVGSVAFVWLRHRLNVVQRGAG